MPPSEPEYYSQGVDYLGFLNAKLRDLRGIPTLANEFIQNADDAQGTTSVAFDFREDALIVENDGVFTDCNDLKRGECPWKEDVSKGHRCDFHRFRRVASGDKRWESETTGAFGIGFIAVYQVTDRPELISSGRHWIIRPEETENRRIEGRRVENTTGTQFRLPWAKDPNTRVRRELGVEAVRPEAPDIFLEELKQTLPNTLLFLRKIKRIDLKQGGHLVKTVERTENEGRVVLRENNTRRSWRVLRGSFEQEAASLRTEFPNGIESKRKSDMAIAVPEFSGGTDGILCAYLPTQHRTGLPFHIHADFFPSSDRKHIEFGQDYQGRWNKAAIRAAAAALCEALPELPELLGHRAFWSLLSRMESVHRDSQNGGREPVFGEFWKNVQPLLRRTKVIWTISDTWEYPQDALLLEKPEEEENLPVLEGLGLNIVHPDLRSHFTLLRSSEIGVGLLGALELANAFHDAGLEESIPLRSAPDWLKTRKKRELLGQEIEILLQRRGDQQPGQKALAGCPMALGVDKRLHPPRDLWKADHDTIRLFQTIGVGTVFLADGNPAAIANLVREFDVTAAVEALEEMEHEVLELGWQDRCWSPAVLLRWFEDRKPHLLPNRDLKRRLCSIPAFPSGDCLRPLSELSVPGEFEDPLRLATLVDLQALNGRREFLIELDVLPLDFLTYAGHQVPQALRSDSDISPELRRALLKLLAEHVSDLKDEEDILDELAGCPLVECKDGTFRLPGEVYFDENEVIEILGAETPVAVLSRTHREAVKDLLSWLGVEGSPRPADLLNRVRSLIQRPPRGEARRGVQKVFEHIGRRWNQEDITGMMESLSTLAWLPAQGDTTTWYRPADLYSIYQRHIFFKSQARFLDIERQTQMGDLIRLLKIESDPPPSLVVAHLLQCVASNEEVHQDVYRFLNNRVQDSALSRLCDEQCILLANGRYVRPDQVFWGEHPFGRFRFRLSSDLRIFSPLFDRLGVSEFPDAEDAVDVLTEISEAFGNNPLDDEAYNVLMQCWVVLSTAIEQGHIDASIFHPLREKKVIPDVRHMVTYPEWVFFEDRPALSAKFGDFLKNNVLSRPQGAWQAMEAVGVRPLSRGVQVDVVECEASVPDEELQAILQERRNLIVRVVEAHRSVSIGEWDLRNLDSLSVERVQWLEVRYSIQIANQSQVVLEPAPIHYDRENNVLYCLKGDNGISHAALARELAYVLNPDAEAGLVAPGLKEVLSASSTKDAVAVLDELGYAPLQEVSLAGSTSQEVVGLGGATEAGPEVEAPEPGPEDTEEPTTPSTPEEAITTILGPDGPAPTPLPGGVAGPEYPAGTPTGGTAPGGGAGGGRPDVRRVKGSRLISYVEPGNGTPPGDPDPDGAAQRSHVDEAGIEQVLEYERRADRNPKEMPHNHPGYDIESRNASEEIERYIEVKSLSGDWGRDGVPLSSKQFEHARDLRDRFWLYVVERAISNHPRVSAIRNPGWKANEFRFDYGWRDLAERVPEDDTGNQEESE